MTLVNKLLLKKNLMIIIIKPPISLETLKNVYPFIETYLQRFQYKILNIIPTDCNDKLYKWEIKPNNKCNECGEVDSIEHHSEPLVL